MSKQPFIFQVIGHGDSGKTTLVSKAISKLKENKLRVATIKHHAHPSPLKAMDEGKDTYLHRQAGAVGSLVASSVELQMHIEHDIEITLEGLLEIYEKFPLDVILIEGFKRKDHPKLLIVRTEEDHQLIHESSNVEAVICWKEEDLEKLKDTVSVPFFLISEEEKYLQWIVEKCKA